MPVVPRGPLSHPARARRLELLWAVLSGMLLGHFFGLSEAVGVTLVGRNLWSAWVNPLQASHVVLYLQEVVLVGVSALLVALLQGAREEGRPMLRLVWVSLGLLPLPFVLEMTVPVVASAALLSGLFGTWIVLRLRRWKPVAGALGALALTALPLTLFAMLPRAASPEGSEALAHPQAPNVLWVVFDTTRADHLSLYGYERKTSPHLETFAADATVFERAYATAPWTVPSHASMLTGLFPREHGCTRAHPFLAPELPVLPQVLAEAGYETALFAGNPWLDAHSGLSRGFQYVFPAWRGALMTSMTLAGTLQRLLNAQDLDKGAGESSRAFASWLDARADARPFFAFVNFTEAHAPYFSIPAQDRMAFVPSGTDEGALRALSTSVFQLHTKLDWQHAELSPQEQTLSTALYDGGIRYEDRRFGELVALLRTRGLLEKTLVIVVADHGEMLGERGEYGHELSLSHPLLHVPLVLRLPGKVPAGRRIDAPVQLTDLFSTVLTLTGHSDRTPAPIRARSLLPALEGTAELERPLFAELYPPLTVPRLSAYLQAKGVEPSTFQFASVQVGSKRFIRGPGVQEQLFDWKVDPEETQNRLQQDPEEARLGRERLAWFEETHPAWSSASPSLPELDDETRARLESMGYIR